MKKLVVAAACAMAFAGAAFAENTPAPEGASVYFIGLEDGATVSSPVMVRFGLSGMGVAPAGTDAENTGHHHLLLNRPPLGEGPTGAAELSDPIPADDNHRHFGGGQTEVVLDLEPGTHTLQLVLGDLSHFLHEPVIKSDVITITVE